MSCQNTFLSIVLKLNEVDPAAKLAKTPRNMESYDFKQKSQNHKTDYTMMLEQDNLNFEQEVFLIYTLANPKGQLEKMRKRNWCWLYDYEDRLQPLNDLECFILESYYQKQKDIEKKKI